LFYLHLQKHYWAKIKIAFILAFKFKEHKFDSMTIAPFCSTTNLLDYSIYQGSFINVSNIFIFEIAALLKMGV